MAIVKQRYERDRLNKGQVAILELLYKYRFGSRALLAKSLGIRAGSSLHERLEVLVKRGYIGRRLDKQLKIQGKPIAYYVLPKGLKTLQTSPTPQSIDEVAIKMSYNNKTVSNDFITHVLMIYEITLSLQRLYPGLKVFTKTDMNGLSYFPTQLPDAFLSIPSNEPQQPYRFFLEVVKDSTPRFVIEKKVADYGEFFEGDRWQQTGSPLPAILFVCESGSFEKRVQRMITRRQAALGSDDPAYSTTTLSALKNAARESLSIWSHVEEPDELCDLLSLHV